MEECKQELFFVGNAHLDPVWMWRWPEGCAEARHTVRSALDRMQEYPDFRFCCSSMSLYQWIEDADPDMFAEIQQRVAEGRWILVGGWYVQPDCNLPSGESFARHALYSQLYFLEKFGKTAKVGYNVDSFGHNGNMPQLLLGSGLQSYVFMRPMFHELTLPAASFRWIGPDGSEVLTTRLACAYNHSNFRSAEDLETVIENVSAEMAPLNRFIPIFYGVGNHGGGPTRQNIDLISAAAGNDSQRHYHFSDLSDYFSALEAEKESLPIWNDELQHHASGCYSAFSPIKRELRRCEGLLYQAEIYSQMAAVLLGRTMPDRKQFAESWQNVLFSEFHDILCGCSIRSAYDDIMDMLGQSKAFAKKTVNSALQALSWAVDSPDPKQGCPIVVFNPHPFPVQQAVIVNAALQSLYAADGTPVPIQPVTSETALTMGRTDTLFLANVPPMGYTCYYNREAVSDVPVTDVCTATAVTHTRHPDHFTALHHHTPVEYQLENARYRILFEERSGFMRSFYDKQENRELLDGYGAVPVVIDEYCHDTWSHKRNSFDREIGTFFDAEFFAVESGPLRAVLKVSSRFGRSRISQYFMLCSGDGPLEVRCVLDWQETHKMLKLRYNWNLNSPTGRYEIPFGSIQRPCCGEEECGQRWIRMEDTEHAVAMINDSKYSFSMLGNQMNLTCVRSPLFADHGGTRHPEAPFTDLGLQEFTYSIFPTPKNSLAQICQQALTLNMPLQHIVENNHCGTLPTIWAGLECDSPNIALSAVKVSEDGAGLVIRVWEIDGKDTYFMLSGPMLPVPLQQHLGRHCARTYRLSNGGSTWEDVLFTELPRT